MSMVTLTIAAAMFTQYWGSRFNLTAATFVLLIIMAMLNACGVRVGLSHDVPQVALIETTALWKS